MPTINISGSGRPPHVVGSDFFYLPFPTGTPSDLDRLDKTRRAIAIVDAYAAGGGADGPCNSHFAAMPGGRTFVSLWGDPSVFISYNPVRRDYGHATEGGRDIALTRWCLDTQNRWVVAATLVHEMAHINRVDASGHGAELSTRRCGFEPQYVPGMIGDAGSIPQLARQLRRFG